jgi:hypothetical protein
MTSHALTEVTEDLVTSLRRALAIAEDAAAAALAAAPAAVPAPRESDDEDLAAKMRRVLSFEAVHAVLMNEVLHGSHPDITARVLAKVEALRLDLIAQVDSIPMLDELQYTLALTFMELKSQWLQRQVRVCYEEMITGSCNPEVALEASGVSFLIGLIEPLLDQEQLDRIQELFAAQTAD